MAQKPIDTTGGAFVVFSIQCIVDEPHAVRVREIQGTQTVVLEITVARGDYKRVIGLKGRTIDALRTLLLNIGGREDRRYVLELVEPSRLLEEIPSCSGWNEPPLPALPADE